MNAALNFILISGINIIFLLLFFLVKKKSLQHKILTLLFIYFAFVAIDGFASLHQLKTIKNIALFFADTIGYFVGPTLWIYILSIFDNDAQLIKKNKWHYAPFLVYASFVTLPTLLCKLVSIPCNYVDFIKGVHLIYNIQPFYLIFYLMTSLTKLKQQRVKLNNVYSNLENKNLDWIGYLIIGFIAIILFYVLCALAEEFFAFQIADIGIYTTTLLLIMIGILGYVGLFQTNLFLPDFIKKENQLKNNPKPIVSISQEEINHFKENLSQIFSIHKPHLNPNLKLADLANYFPISPKRLTLLLNQELKTSFYEYVNDMRIKEFKQRLKNGDYNNLTLLAIAFESGFNSKTSFNRIFKSVEGITPKAYLKKLSTN